MANLEAFDSSSRPILEEHSRLLNKILEKDPIDGVKPLKIVSDHDCKESLYQKLEQYKYPCFEEFNEPNAHFL